MNEQNKNQPVNDDYDGFLPHLAHSSKWRETKKYLYGACCIPRETIYERYFTWAGLKEVFLKNENLGNEDIYSLIYNLFSFLLISLDGVAGENWIRTKGNSVISTETCLAFLLPRSLWLLRCSWVQFLLKDLWSLFCKINGLQRLTWPQIFSHKSWNMKLQLPSRLHCSIHFYMNSNESYVLIKSVSYINILIKL